MRILSVLLLLLCCNAGYGQQNDVDFLISKIKNDYAGYLDKTTDKQFDQYLKTVLEKEKSDTFNMLSKMVLYFNDQHLQLFAVNALKEKPVDTLTCNRNVAMVTDYFNDSRSKKKDYEGYWMNDIGTNIIAIKQHEGRYKGYLMQSTQSVVAPGFVLLSFEKIKSGKSLVKYTIPRTAAQVVVKCRFSNDSTLFTGDFAKWKKIDPQQVKILLANMQPLESIARGQALDNDNYLLTLPSFKAANIALIDSIVKQDHQKIASSKNLIIDIRGNDGGRVKCYAPLLPFIYTHPIIGISGYTRCTPDLVEHRKEGLANYLKNDVIDSATVKEIEKEIANAENNIGTFFFEAGDTMRLDSVSAYPKNVAIISNYACESASEMMLLDFKQSKKVTIFGEHTMGAIDYLNTYNITLPSGKYILGLATVKRHIPNGGKKLDGTGIYPDVNIPAQINDWVGYVKEYYKKKNSSGR